MANVGFINGYQFYTSAEALFAGGVKNISFPDLSDYELEQLIIYSGRVESYNESFGGAYGNLDTAANFLTELERFGGGRTVSAGAIIPH